MRIRALVTMVVLALALVMSGCSKETKEAIHTFVTTPKPVTPAAAPPVVPPPAALPTMTVDLKDGKPIPPDLQGVTIILSSRGTIAKVTAGWSRDWNTVAFTADQYREYKRLENAGYSYKPGVGIRLANEKAYFGLVAVDKPNAGYRLWELYGPAKELKIKGNDFLTALNAESKKALDQMTIKATFETSIELEDAGKPAGRTITFHTDQNVDVSALIEDSTEVTITVTGQRP